MRQNILIVEDDSVIAEGLAYALLGEGFLVKRAACAADCKTLVADEKFDLILLDVGLPDGTGYELCKLIKAQSDTPIIFLTACDDEVNVVMGLELGADDYVTKPFRIRELITRIKTVLRRAGRNPVADMLTIGNISINVSQAKVYKNKSEIFLTALEYRLLLTLAGHRGQVLSRNQLLEGIWDVSGDFVNDNTLTVYMKRLREKLEDNPAKPKLIKTVRGLGYMME
ncbi:MAG: response regulator transcription factor [Catenibacillus sp.]|nr:response regulator transcription factor [Catenibacillus sp.]